MSVIPLRDARDEGVFGGKAASLGAAIRAGLPVPPGFALAAAFVDLVAAADSEALACLASQPLTGQRLAVRSSAIGEDSADASFAGQHVTRLNVTRAQLAEAVRAVWESARTESALAYRAKKGLTPEPRIGAVIQTLVEPKCAGVLFTRNPMTGASERVIEAAWGLGEAVVNGAVTPDRYIVSPEGEIVDTMPGYKDIKIWFGEGDGTIEVPLGEEWQQVPCLARADLDALHSLAERCQCAWGADLDIEWAVAEDGRLYLLQCRPITTGLTGPR